MDGNAPCQPDKNSITISVRFKCNLCDFQCLRLPEAEQHSMIQHCTIQPFFCNTCTVSCKTYHDALSHLATPSAGHWQLPKMEERDVERWAQFQFVLTSYTVFLTVTCREDIVFLCCVCTNSTSDTEAAVKHLVSHNIWKRDNVKGHCDICTFYYLSGIESIKQLRDFSGALNGRTHNIAACLLSNLKITLQPYLGRSGLKSQTINWSALFSSKKPNMLGSAMPFVPEIPTRPESHFARPQPQNTFALSSNRFSNPTWPSAPLTQPNNGPMLQPPAAVPWYSSGNNFSGNPLLPGPTMSRAPGPPSVRFPKPAFLQPPPNIIWPTRLTFEQHMARERMIWLMDERYRRQMNEGKGVLSRTKVRRRSAVQTSTSSSPSSKEPPAPSNKENNVSQKRAQHNKSRPITVIDLTHIEGEEDRNDVVTTGVDNVSSTTSNGENDTEAKKPSNDDNNVENTKTDDHSNNKPEDKNNNENELDSTTNQTETTHMYYDEIFLEDDHGFYSDVPSEDEDVTNQQILDLSVKKDGLPPIGTEVIPLDLTNDASI